MFTSPTRVIAGDPNRTFSLTTSTLIFGTSDAVLVDALLIKEDVDALGDMIASTSRTLTTIFITHGHGDHVFGSDRLIARFPGARAVTTPGIVDYKTPQKSVPPIGENVRVELRHRMKIRPFGANAISVVPTKGLSQQRDAR